MERRDRVLAAVEARLRASLRTLDDVPVTPLARIRARERARWPGRMAGAVAAVAVLVLALALGERLSAWRLDRAAATPAAPSLGATGSIALDARYGYLVQLPAKGGLALVNEKGEQLLGPLDGVNQAVTSPNGRYVAMWVAKGSTNELLVLDGVTRKVGPPLFTSTETFARSSRGIVWADSSDALVLATTADPVANSAGEIRTVLRTVTLGGEVRTVTTYSTFAFTPLAWDTRAGIILASALASQSGGSHYLRISASGGSVLSDRVVDDNPLIADDSGVWVVASANCTPSPQPCRRIVIHDSVTYAAQWQYDLPPTTSPNNNWGVQFRPRSPDLVVNYSRAIGPNEGTFALQLYGPARNAPVDLGDLRVAAVGGIVYSPLAYVRADGSAIAYLHRTSSAGTGDVTGVLVDVSGARTTMTLAAPVASVLLDASLVLPTAAAGPSPTPASSSAPSSLFPICPLGQGPVLDVAHGPPPGAQPGTGSADAESAFRRAFPQVTSFTMYPFGSDKAAPPREIKSLAWIVAGRDTYVSMVLGRADEPNNWFAYRATFLECRAPTSLVNRPLYPTRTAAEVLLGLTSDAAWVHMREQAGRPGGPLSDPRVAAATLGEPLLVRALDPREPDNWAVPVMYQGEPVEILVVGRDASGMGNLGMSRGYGWPSFPRISEDEAKARVRAVAGSALETTLVWCNCGRIASDVTSPVWRITTAGSDVYLVFTEGPEPGVGRAAEWGY